MRKIMQKVRAAAASICSILVKDIFIFYATLILLSSFFVLSC